MYDSKTAKLVKTRKKRIYCFLATLLCTLVIVSSIESSSAIRNSFAQAQQQLQAQQSQAPTIAYKSPWSNNLQISSASSNSQLLCQAGICSQSSDPAHATQTQPQNIVSSFTTTPGSADPTSVILTKSFTNSKNLNLNNSFVSNKVVGPDRFRFITSYWTAPNTSLGVDVGTSANNTFQRALYHQIRN
ncbi:MAG: hypothetical protein WBZ36_23720 [Candidatus Nitrosopolaris sp.]